MSVELLLGQMADGEFHSGEALGELLGVSRTAVWKHLQKLEGLGLQLESVKGKGYRIPGGVELLDADVITQGLRPAASAFIKQMDVLQTVDSTNSRAMQKVVEGSGHGYLCLAEYQTAGRGRRGRQWVSPFGQSLYLSVVVEFKEGAAALEGLSLAVGVALVRALEEVGATEIGLKWPNDVLWRGKKLAGVLLEMTGDPSGVCQVVVGLGVNMSLSEGVVQSIDQPWVDVATIVPGVSRNQFAVSLFNHLLPVLSGFSVVGFSQYKDEWESHHVHAGASVELAFGVNESVAGVALGVTETGALRLDVSGEERVYSGGEVSLRSV
ncbi:MAG: bifunctional biotin--[acetyl-CoA-carboxylase] ligase/biotin operon repressor BirA [Candidatus Pelagadaptatus aseana]|uniref:bifunctional biotin--[acetyl-CoA-carboxylase] ligase/biotin operon repressor BirA n=1 Tax=Candidatus Pelagadaptatus aseana TaxID=3120508 RepID=UPI0039B1F022